MNEMDIDGCSKKGKARTIITDIEVHDDALGTWIQAMTNMICVSICIFTTRSKLLELQANRQLEPNMILV